MGGGAYRALNQQPSGFTPISGFRKSEILKKKFKAFTLAEVLIPKRVSGIDNKVRYSRASEIKEPLRNTKKLCAFTLAEVLITLAIIGVVAALTIPTVVQKYQQKMYYTQFIKMFSSLSTAFEMAESENGTINTWGITQENKDEVVEKTLFSYLKVSKKLTTNDTEFDYPVSLLNGKSRSDEPGYEGDYTFLQLIISNDMTYVLADGSIIAVDVDVDIYSSHQLGNELWFTIDTNGKKGPNVVGRDIFVDVIYAYDNDSNKWGWRDKTKEFDDCNPKDSDSRGVTCFEKLLQEGKMDY